MKLRFSINQVLDGLCLHTLEIIGWCLTYACTCVYCFQNGGANFIEQGFSSFWTVEPLKSSCTNMSICVYFLIRTLCSQKYEYGQKTNEIK